MIAHERVGMHGQRELPCEFDYTIFIHGALRPDRAGSS